jgi:hypothetical protein
MQYTDFTNPEYGNDNRAAYNAIAAKRSLSTLNFFSK